MKKVMKTFTFGSKGFMRILLLCMIACFSLTQARADYYYKVKLADKDGNVHQINGKEWSDWIFVSKGSGLANALNKLIGGKFSEQEKDASGNLKFKYNDNNVEKEISLSETVVEKLTKNQDGNYLYNIGGTKHELIPVTKDVYRLGTTIKDESGIAINLEYDGGEGTIVENEDNCYKNCGHKYKIVGMVIGRGTDEGNILQYSDHAAFGRMKDDLKELDLAAWDKETFTGSYYMSNMSNLETLILPDHNFAIGDSYTFAGANKLKEIKYGNYGQDNNAATVSITNNCNVTCIGYAAFENCNNLPGSYIQAMVNSAAAYAQTHENGPGLEYDKIGDKAFYCCQAFTGDLNIPAGIKRIGSEAFAESKITNLNCPAAITVIGEKAFRDNKSLETFTIGANIDKIDDKAFINDDKLQNLTSGYKIGTIGNNAFQACYGLNSVDINDVGTIGIEAFYMGNQKSALTTVSLGGANIRIDSKAFRACGWLTNFGLKSEAKIKQLNDGVFLDCRTFTSASVKTILDNYAEYSDQLKEGEKYIPANLFFGVNGHYDYGTDAEKKVAHDNFTELTIPSQFAYIGKGAFGVSEKGYNYISSIKVSREKAPDCRSIDGTNSVVSGRGTFENVEPNHVTITFNDAAAGYSTDGSTGYMTYRNELEFMRLLTKTLDENSTDYTVVPQRHADVRLYRTFKEGWNTLVLPFGARVIEGRDVDAAEIFQKALNVANDNDNVSNPNDTPGFMIAAYRGLAKNEAQPDNSTFYFLQYANYKEDPLDECEPLLIKMRQEDINKANGVYTFKDVELNYDGDNNTTYTADEVIARMGKKENGNYFDGNYNHDANDKFGKCSYDDFYFTGTLYKQDTDKNPAFIAPGDYIIQNNTFVKCLSGKKYGLKGFRGYFKQKPLGRTSPAKGIGICLVDRNGVVSSIHQVDGVSLTSASVAPVAVYNLSGQQVGNSLSTLAKGVYIVNGKKFVKK